MMLTDGRPTSWIRAATAAVLVSAVWLGSQDLFGLSREELERYGFSRDVAGSAREGTLRPIPPPATRRRVPVTPFVPRADATPASRIPAPTRPRAEVRLTPRGGKLPIAPEADVHLPEPPREPDPVVLKIFPDQARDAYAGDAACLSCHAIKGHDQPHSLYGLILNNKGVPAERRGCEGCHGPGSGHVAGRGDITNPAKLDHPAISRLCLSCHEDQRLVRRLEWHISGHQEAFVACTTCHSVHAPKVKPTLKDEPDRLCLSCHRDQLARFRLRSHHPVKPEGSDGLSAQREGKVRCIDCHMPYSTRNGVNLLGREERDLCTKCHAETRGPFLFEHDAAGGDDARACTVCHQAHGSPNRDLLIVQGRPLCLRCHTDRVAHNPGPSCYNAQCHRDIHGSNLNQFFIPR